MYPELKVHNMEVVYVSLDTEKSDFEPVAAEYPWVSYFDYGGWSSKPVLDYHVFASPTIYLLGKNLEILYKVVSPEHLEAILKVLSSEFEENLFIVKGCNIVVDYGKIFLLEVNNRAFFVRLFYLR